MSHAQSSGQSSISARTPRRDASTLVVTAFNVGMIQADAFTKMQDSKVAELAGYVERGLEEGNGPVYHLKISLSQIIRPLRSVIC